MGSTALKQARDQALTLAEDERAELAHDLVASLDGGPEPDVAEAWDEELRRRLDQIEQGSVNLIGRDEFNRRLHAKLGSGSRN